MKPYGRVMYNWEPNHHSKKSERQLSKIIILEAFSDEEEYARGRNWDDYDDYPSTVSDYIIPMPEGSWFDNWNMVESGNYGEY